MFTTKIILVSLLACLSAAVVRGVPVAGRGDPLLNPLFSGARQESFSSMPVGERPARVDVSVATVVNTGNPDGNSLKISDVGGRGNTMGRFMAVQRSRAFQLEFGFSGVTAFAFNVGGLTHDMRVELYDDTMRLVESFRVRALGRDARGTYIGAYTPTVPVHYAVFTSEGANEALSVDNLTVVAMKPPTPTPPYVPARVAAGLTDGSGGSEAVRVPDYGSSIFLLAVALAGLIALRRRLV